MIEPQIGVIIGSGLADWQILQQDATGFATLTLHGRWVNDATNTAHAANRDDANPAHSPYLHFARLLKQQLGYPIGLVQTASVSRLSQWNPTEEEDAPLYHTMLHCIEQVGSTVKGILWY